MAAATLPDDLLRDTFARMAARYPAWPRTFEECLRDPVRIRLVRLTATRRLQAATARTTAPACPAPARQQPARPPARAPLPAPSTPAPSFDRKRAASGDRDD